MIFGYPKWLPAAILLKTFAKQVGRLQLYINSLLVNIYIQTGMLGTREYTLCSPFRANAHNSIFLRFYYTYTVKFAVKSFETVARNKQLLQTNMEGGRGSI